MACPRTGQWTPAVHRPLAQAASGTHHPIRIASGSCLTDAPDQRSRSANNTAGNIFQAATDRIETVDRRRIPSQRTRERVRRAYRYTLAAARSRTLYVPIAEQLAWLFLLLLAA